MVFVSMLEQRFGEQSLAQLVVVESMSLARLLMVVERSETADVKVVMSLRTWLRELLMLATAGHTANKVVRQTLETYLIVLCFAQPCAKTGLDKLYTQAK